MLLAVARASVRPASVVRISPGRQQRRHPYPAARGRKYHREILAWSADCAAPLLRLAEPLRTEFCLWTALQLCQTTPAFLVAGFPRCQALPGR